MSDKDREVLSYGSIEPEGDDDDDDEIFRL